MCDHVCYVLYYHAYSIVYLNKAAYHCLMSPILIATLIIVMLGLHVPLLDGVITFSII